MEDKNISDQLKHMARNYDHAIKEIVVLRANNSSLIAKNMEQEAELKALRYFKKLHSKKPIAD
jgi:regulator of replication initiation timing